MGLVINKEDSQMIIVMKHDATVKQTSSVIKKAQEHKCTRHKIS